MGKQPQPSVMMNTRATNPDNSQSGNCRDGRHQPSTFEATVADTRAAILKELAGGETRTSAVTLALVDDRHLLVWDDEGGMVFILPEANLIDETLERLLEQTPLV